MKRIALMVVWGSILFAAGEAGACEAHAARATPAASSAPEAQEAPAAARTEEPVKKPAVDEPHAARCQCGSAADCTCKKGTCECAKCKKPRRDEAPVEAEAVAARPGAAKV